MSRTRRNFTAKYKSDLGLIVLKGKKELISAQPKQCGYHIGRKKVQKWMTRVAGLTTSRSNGDSAPSSMRKST